MSPTGIKSFVYCGLLSTISLTSSAVYTFASVPSLSILGSIFTNILLTLSAFSIRLVSVPVLSYSLILLVVSLPSSVAWALSSLASSVSSTSCSVGKITSSSTSSSSTSSICWPSFLLFLILINSVWLFQILFTSSRLLSSNTKS